MRPRSIPLVLVLVVGILLIAGSPAGAGGSCSGGPFQDERTTEIKVHGVCFAPTVARINVGDTVTFFNGDEMVHMVGGMAGSFGSLHTELGRGETLSYRFDEEGVFPYACILHPGMGGAIVVGDGEGKLTSSGVTQVGRRLAGDASTTESGSAATSPTAAEGDRSWVLPATAALGLAALMMIAIAMITRARGRGLSGSRSASTRSASSAEAS